MIGGFCLETKGDDFIKTPVSWVGNKTSILPIVLAAFPLTYERYIEPFGGSGAVLLGKEKPDKFEVYNDYNQDLVNLFLCMRDRPMALIDELGFMNLNSRAEFKLMTAFLDKKPTPKLFLEEEIALTTDKSKDKDFVKDYVSCFKKDYSNADVVNAVNKKFGKEVELEYINKMVKSASGSKISLNGYYDPKVKNNLDLAEWCKNANKNGWGYVYGAYGQICTTAFLDQQAASWPGANEAGGPMRTVGEKWLGKRVTDCIGLIKSYAWYNPNDGSIKPGANGFTDCSADSIWGMVSESGDISSIPEVPGLAVWQSGHIGVYIGNGEVVEAMGTAYGVVKTKVAGRGWSKWLKIPNIQYVKKQDATQKPKKESDKIKKKKTKKE